jgi:hypothetical protein
MKRGAIVFIALLTLAHGAAAQKKAPEKSPAKARQNGEIASPPVSLSPRFSVGQAFRYEMEFETTTATSRSGFAADPQGPSQLVITWNATIRMEVLPAEPSDPGSLRLRMTYEKSMANVRADTFDPTASATQLQYQKLEGKVVEFTLDASRKVKSIAGLEGIVEGDKAMLAARQWIAQLDAGSGAPPGGVRVGQTWSSEQPATSLLLPGLVWHNDSRYLRNEACHPPNPDAASVSPTTDSSVSPESAETCAVILTRLSIVRPKPIRHAPQDKSEVKTEGTWNGSGESLSYISLPTGLVVSVTQSATENMDVTITSAQNTSMRYAGTILSRSQVALVADDAQKK